MKRICSILLFLIISGKVNSQSFNLICNGNFENPVVSSSPGMCSVSILSCWQTTAPDQMVELWQSGFNLVPSYSGNQFLELNANYVSTIFQDFYASPGSSLEISFAHRGRAGIDTLSVEVGPIGGPYSNLGYFADDNTNWGHYTIYASVPNPGNLYRIKFISVYAALQLPSVGNFLDSVTVYYSKTGIQEQFGNFHLSISPNPFNQSFNLILPENTTTPVRISITDLHGKTVYDGKLPASENRYFNLEIPELVNGIYLLKAESSGTVYHKKIVRLE